MASHAKYKAELCTNINGQSMICNATHKEKNILYRMIRMMIRMDKKEAFENKKLSL